MNLYITSGTLEFLQAILSKNNKERMILIHNSTTSLLLHETTQKSLFKLPRKYEVIDAVEELLQEGLIIMNNIPVSEEGRPTFEHMSKKNLEILRKQPGIKAIRILRPIKSETYIILTQWKDEIAFKAWQNNASYQSAFNYEGVTSSSQKLFTGNAFITQYSAPKLNDK